MHLIVKSLTADGKFELQYWAINIVNNANEQAYFAKILTYDPGD